MSARILIGVCGSIGSISIPSYIYVIKSKFPNVQVILTHSCQQFISKEAMSLVAKTHVDLLTSSQQGASHIQLAEWADLFVIIPATAQVIAQTAHGFADTFLSTTILSHSKPVLFFPNMNASLWNNQATQKNLSLVKELGHSIIDATLGEGYEVANGKQSKGEYLPTPEQVLKILAEELSQREQSPCPTS